MTRLPLPRGSARYALVAGALALAVLSGCGNDATRPGVASTDEQPPLLHRLGESEPGIASPGEVALGPGEDLYVIDRESKIFQFDAGGHLRKILDPGFGGDPVWPAGLAVTPAGDVWVADARQRELLLLRADGSEPLRVRPPAEGAVAFDYPTSVALDAQGNVYVLDRGALRISAFAPDGAFLRQWGKECAEGCGFEAPVALTVSPGGMVYVTDRELGRVVQFTVDGEWVRQFGTKGWGAGQLDGPAGLAVDPEGRLRVYDRYRGVILAYSLDGLYLGEVAVSGGRYSSESNSLPINAAGEFFLPIRDDIGGVHRLAPDGRLLTVIGHRPGFGPGGLIDPRAVVADEQGRVFVLDTRDGGVNAYDANGGFLRRWGPTGAADNLTRRVRAIAVDRLERLYRVDYYGQFILRTPFDGARTDTLWLSRTRDYDLYVAAAAVDAEGWIYLLDRGAGRILKISPEGQPASGWTPLEGIRGTYAGLSDLAFDPRGRLWVVEQREGLLEATDTSGNRLALWRLPQDGPARGYEPFRLDFDDGGNVLLLAYGYAGRRVLKLTASGVFVTRWNFLGGESLGECVVQDLAWSRGSGRLNLVVGGGACAGVAVFGY